jgi:hypothetical protein
MPGDRCRFHRKIQKVCAKDKTHPFGWDTHLLSEGGRLLVGSNHGRYGNEHLRFPPLDLFIHHLIQNAETLLRN